MKVKNRTLLLIAAVVWSIAGFNILRIGLVAYEGYWTLLNLLISIVIFSLFWFMVFKQLVNKHTERIINYREKKNLFLKFFDVKSFIIMAIMMTLGLLIRSFKLWPLQWISVFFLRLGSDLSLSGLLFCGVVLAKQTHSLFKFK
ncbi:hypothetical protein ACQV2T_07220 [Facklamia sp. P13069]|uniref:hypothetical protein n=1 Tax=Facklamia sp. P13069 TaxID=3421954 RepID=UPI003D1740AB